MSLLDNVCESCELNNNAEFNTLTCPHLEHGSCSHEYQLYNWQTIIDLDNTD